MPPVAFVSQQVYPNRKVGRVQLGFQAQAVTLTGPLFRQQIAKTAFEAGAAPVNNPDPVGQTVHIVQQMGAQQHSGGPIGREFEQQVVDFAPTLGIEPIRGLVQYQQSGVRHESPGHRQTLFHSPGIGSDGAVALGAETDFFQQYPQIRVGLCFSVQTAVPSQVGWGGHPLVKPGVFRHHPDRTANRSGIFPGITTQNADATASVRTQTQQGENGGGLSGAVGTEKTIDITGLQVQIDAFEDFLSLNG